MAEDGGERPGGDHPEGSGEPGEVSDNGKPSDEEYFPGERGRRAPRSAWWVLGIACVVLAGFLIARPVWFTEPADPTALNVPPDRHFSKTLGGLGYEDGVRLTDDASSSTFAVSLPVDSGREKTQIRMSGTTQIADASTVFLTVAVDGSQVYKAQLPSGEHDLDEVVPVPESLAADGTVRVRVSVQGALHEGVCMPDHSAGMRVHLDGGTLVEAALDEPVHTVRDAVSAWDHDMTLVTADGSDEWRTTAAQVGLALTQAGHDVAYADAVPDSDREDSVLIGPPGALSAEYGLDAGDVGDAEERDAGAGLTVGTVDGTPLLAVVQPRGDVLAQYLTSPAVVSGDAPHTDPRAVATTGPSGDAVGLYGLGADDAVVQVREEHSWRVRYSTADLPGGRLPDGVHVDFSVPATPDDVVWVLDTLVNGNLVDSRRLQRDGGPIDIPLPPGGQRLDNEVVLTVQRDRDLGGCDVRVTSYPFQLLGPSALTLGADPGTGLTGVPGALAPGFTVYVNDPHAAVVPSATNPIPGEMNAMLTSVVPILARFVPADYTPPFFWGAPPAAREPFILVGSAPGIDTPARVSDGRLTAGDGPMLDLTAPAGGVMVQCATGASGARGLGIEPFGETGAYTAPGFGDECTAVVTAGGGFTLDAAGAVVDGGAPRAAPPR
ncbi:hypothetical protein [Tomitella fengzijianii]|uniref:Uncharacterized protein n=1 Tax=Tomitella fengzijianii TaxID=2597660 RepID=A0A516X676_9ACTN|nr:hypothetical protein [Tomitella fengzijianii]QDQ98578.1 hypothetical protein FO059_16180 [Tomitella fengzijianii]